MICYSMFLKELWTIYVDKHHEHGEVLKWHDGYYIKRKKDLVGMIEDMLGENSQLDVGKYAEKLINHFMPNKERKSN